MTQCRWVMPVRLSASPSGGWPQVTVSSAHKPSPVHHQDRNTLQDRRYLLHDRDAKFSDSFRDTVMAGGVKPLKLPARSPNLNSFAERWVRSVKEECLSKLVLFGEGSLRRAVGEYVTHFLEERNHQGKGNVLLFPRNEEIIGSRKGRVRCKGLWCKREGGGR